MSSSVNTGAGVGVAEKGFDDEVVDALDSVDSVEIFESAEDWRDLRRNGMEGRRKVGKTEGTV